METVVNFIIENKVVLVAAIPYISRAYYSLSNGGGIMGVWRSIMFGTNTPKQ